ncbi:hypothetical protein BDW02DRAFT_581204 [Decorospora gaudefroyi]|uniref:Uncharacterized protein n=1 Tax=Decorospora gaudefroyi TaxID=184978 RepID=A0A6A5KBB4_9PLEO|nr:hypothetical protein BDW02DRAFT_581204 [Decorospora gaudefroyi]
MRSTKERVRYSYLERRGSPSLQHVDQKRIPSDYLITSETYAAPEYHNQGLPIVSPPLAHTAHHHHTDTRRFSRPKAAAVNPSKVDETKVEVWKNARAQITPLRELIFGTRMDVKREKYKCHLQEEQYEKIMENLMATLNTATTPESDLQNIHTLNGLSLELKHCRNELNATRKRTFALEDILSCHERRMHQMEDDAYTDFMKINLENDELDRVQVQSSSVRTVLPQTSHTNCGLLARLYTRMGDTRIHFERLNNFEFDFREEMEERELIRASGQLEDTTDAQFFEQMKAERIKIQQDLEEAQKEVETLKNLCIQNGIDFEEPQVPDMLPDAGPEDYSKIFDPSTLTQDVQPGSSSVIGAFFNAQDRVARWLRASSGSPSSDKDETKDEPEPQRRRESQSTDMGWVLTPSTAKHPVSLTASSEHGPGDQDLPVWTSGPGPGSRLLEALLLESATTPLGTFDAHRKRLGNHSP